MTYQERRAASRALADAIIEAVGQIDGKRSYWADSAYMAAEWEVAAMEALDYALEKSIPVPRQLVTEANNIWLGFFEGQVQDQWYGIPDTEAKPDAAIAEEAQPPV